ncbi:MAG: fimbrial protein [Haemophilus parahaemolyticus]|nr:fimbrial protein [Haemophilus parahaemolyticus]
MKKLTLAASLVLGFGLVANANAVDGTVTFDGKIVDQTCTVATAANKDQTVKLPTVQSSSLATPNSKAGETPFTISLSGCKTKATSGISKVKAFFLPNATNVDENTHNLINIEKNSPATHVQVQLLNKDLTEIKVGENITAQNVNGTDIDDTGKADGAVTAELKYFARYYATGTVTAGKVTSKVEYNIVYE